MTARQPGEGIIPDEVELVSDDVSPLTREQIVAGLGQVGLTPLHAGSHAFLSCTISDLALTNLDPALRKYCNLQVIDVSHNKLRRLDALSEMPFLRVIDASHNLLRRPDCFSFPKFLEKVDMSYNDIQELGDWSNCRGHLRTLNLRGNSIKCIPPHSLQRTTLLDILDLSENQITTAENLSGLRELTTLRLADNQLISAPNLNGLTTLRELDLAGNFMKSLEGFKDSICPRMIKLDLSRNQIEDLPAVVEAIHRAFPEIGDLNIKTNPITQLPLFNLRVIYHLTTLVVLNGEQVKSKNRVDSEELHGDLLQEEREAWTSLMAAVRPSIGQDVNFQDHRLITIEDLT